MPVVRHSRDFWEQASREVDRGFRVVEVARRLGVRPKTLSWWRWNLGRQKPAGRRATAAPFLPVVVAERPSLGVAVPVPIEIETCGVRLRVEIGGDVGYVAALVAAIRSTC